MRIALIGPPQSGKTSLLGALSGKLPDPAHVGLEHMEILPIDDLRLTHLRDHFHPKKFTPIPLEVVDFPGFSTESEASRVEMTKHLPSLRLCDLFVAVLRSFESDSVPPYRGRIDPIADLAEIRDELLFCDLEQVARRIEKLDVSSKKPTKTQAQEKRELELMRRIRETLEEEKPVSVAVRSRDDEQLTRSFGFLTEKPMTKVLNVGESEIGPDEHTPSGLEDALITSAEIEAELARLQDDERAPFMEEMGVVEPIQNKLVRPATQAAGMISFFTVGDDEVKAWPLRDGDDALTAAGKIHSDIARGFIRAETTAYEDFLEAGDFKAAQAAGKLRLEGKAYRVQDGDIINFRFNV
jgi:hypothetical protein